MSRNGSGTYNLPAGNPVVTGTTITSTWANTTLADIASALTGSLAADGQTTATGPLNMGTQKITNISAGTTSTDVAAVSQVTSAVAITGGAIDGTPIGVTTPSTGKFTSLNVTTNFALNGDEGTAGKVLTSAGTGNLPTWTTAGASTGPAFSAYQSSAQTIPSTSYTKVTFTTKEFDTNTNYDTTTSRFTPTVAGYYQVNAGVGMGVGASSIYLMIYKNGVVAKYGQYPASAYDASMSTLIQMNGTTDYLEVYVFLSTGQALANTSANTYFQASLARSA